MMNMKFRRMVAFFGILFVLLFTVAPLRASAVGDIIEKICGICEVGEIVDNVCSICDIGDVIKVVCEVCGVGEIVDDICKICDVGDIIDQLKPAVPDNKNYISKYIDRENIMYKTLKDFGCDLAAPISNGYDMGILGFQYSFAVGIIFAITKITLRFISNVTRTGL